MPTRQVTIQGVMTWDEGGTGIWGPTDPRPGYGLPEPPPRIWGGGNVPMPTPPIHLGPGGEVGGPPGIWGPTDPRPGYGLPGQPPRIWGGGNVPMPTPPIHLGPGGEVGGPPGIWGPTDPRPGYGLPGGQPGGGSVSPPAAGVPIHGSMTWVPGYGYVFVPDGAKPEPPDGERPKVDHTLPTPDPQPKK